MSAYIETMDARMKQLNDDVSLLVTLHVADQETKSKIIDMIRQGAADAKLQGSDESINTAREESKLQADGL
jgi:predicted DNA-binding ArsR family transcriptional regulator